IRVHPGYPALHCADGDLQRRDVQYHALSIQSGHHQRLPVRVPCYHLPGRPVHMGQLYGGRLLQRGRYQDTHIEAQCTAVPQRQCRQLLPAVLRRNSASWL
ncbi:hypothetical protein GGI24_003739, partial [Coemansia furcata]